MRENEVKRTGRKDRRWTVSKKGGKEKTGATMPPVSCVVGDGLITWQKGKQRLGLWVSEIMNVIIAHRYSKRSMLQRKLRYRTSMNVVTHYISILLLEIHMFFMYGIWNKLNIVNITILHLQLIFVRKCRKVSGNIHWIGEQGYFWVICS